MLKVIVPAYNEEKNLCRCIESIRAQSYLDIRIVIVNDGSTDHTGKIADDFAAHDGRVTVVHQENQGLLCARRAGLLSGNSHYVTFVDADDWIERDTYQTCCNYMEQGIDVIEYGQYQNTSSRQIQKTRHYPAGFYEGRHLTEEILSSLIWDCEKDAWGMSPSLCDKIIKQDLLLKSYFMAKDLQLYYGEDSAIFYPLMQWVHSVQIMPETFYHHCKEDYADSTYVRDDAFFDDIYTWYRYLRAHIHAIPNAREQIERFYLAQISIRRSIYKNVRKQSCVLFPFHIVAPGSRVVLWGAGYAGGIFYEQIHRLAYCRLAGWIDSEATTYGEMRLSRPEALPGMEFDYVVISVVRKDVAEQIKRQLTTLLVPGEKIVWSKACFD